MSIIQAVLFDKDGTLFDFGLTWGPWTASFIHGLARDTDHASALARAMRFDLDAQRHLSDSPFVAGSVEDWMPVLLPLLSEHGKESLLDHITRCTGDAPQVPATPLPPLLEGLRKQGYRLGVATNDGFAPVSRHLADAGIAHLFDFVAGYDSGHGSKPAPGMLLAFSSSTGVAPDATVMVGDSLHDLDAARAAGMRAVAVLTGSAPADVLAPHAEAVLPSIAGLPMWLERQKTGIGPSQTGPTGVRLAD